MKFTNIITVVVALGAEVALASPVGQQAPVHPQPQPDCLPDGVYATQAGLPASACCSGYFADGHCKPKPAHLLVKDSEKRDPLPLGCTGDESCSDGPITSKIRRALGPAPAPILSPSSSSTPPPPPPPPPPPSTTEGDTKTPVCGFDDSSCDVKTPVCGFDDASCATVTSVAGSSCSQAPDGQVQCAPAAVGNKGAADIVPASVSSGVFTEATTSLSQPTFQTSFDNTAPLPAETGQSTNLDTQLPIPIPFTQWFPLPPTFQTSSDGTPTVPIKTGSSSQLDTDVPSPEPSTPWIFTNPIRPTDTAITTQLDTHVPVPVGTGASRHPIGPGFSHTLAHKPYPTDKHPGAWDPNPSTGHPVKPSQPTAPHPEPVVRPTVAPPRPTFPSWSYTKRAFGPLHGGSGRDHDLANRQVPTTLATVVLEERSTNEWPSVQRIRPGWDHNLAHRPYPTHVSYRPFPVIYILPRYRSNNVPNPVKI
ncbi:MAG: hypothetical protein Q9172_006168 [Xanthocarpia lactea]